MTVQYHIQKIYPEVFVIALSENLGFFAPNNLVMRNSKSKYICLLNNDTKLHTECLEFLLQTLEDDPKKGICDAKKFFV